MLRYLLPPLCCVLLAANVSAGDKAKPNTLTEKEIHEGWILLFDGETTFGWKGSVAVKNGWLVVGPGQRQAIATLTTQFPEAKLVWEEFHAKANSPTKKATLYTKKIAGGTSIQFKQPAKITGYYRNIKLKPVHTKALFNAKSLDGWKVFRGSKSKYTVTKEGWLNVKNGRGDIQTTDIFRNFALQVECISNGKHLNSGIFFRCIPGQYQQGYEAQIRNEFTPGQKRAYVLSKYDPKTHKKISTYKVESTAVDYGTGAIYRRMPARKQMSKDRKWFAMTVVAQGRHFATWVNGIQVADWTDNRPKNANARKGYFPFAGAISIQGHDPTTNLSFRHIRIAEFPSVGKK